MAKIMIISSWFPVSQMLNWLEVHVTVENTSEGQLTITLCLQEREVAIINKYNLYQRRQYCVKSEFCIVS